jgi:hypothetical protein
MGLSKITKSVVAGSLLVQYKYQDLTDTNSSGAPNSFFNWGSPLQLTPKYEDSTFEFEMSGGLYRANTGSDIAYEVRLLINGQQEHIQTNMFGGYTQGDNWQNQPHTNVTRQHDHHDYHRVHEHVADGWRTVGTQYVQNTRHSIRMTHNHRPLNKNLQTFQLQFRTNNSSSTQFAVGCYSGFMVVKEISVNKS